MTGDRCCFGGLVRIRQRAMSGPGKSTDMALSISMGNMRTKKVPCAPKKYPGKVLFFKQFLCILRAVSLCVYTKSAHTQVFSGVFARIFTRRKCRRVRHRAAASAVGGLCRGLREWEVSVLLHCHFTSLCRHKDKQVSDSFQGFRGICCSVFSHWRSIYSRNDIQVPYSQPFTEPVSLLLFLPGTTRNSHLCLAVPPPVLTRTCGRGRGYG